MKKLFINLIALSLVSLGYSQQSVYTDTANEVTLEGVTVSPLNISYLSMVQEESMPDHVTELENKAARYDITKSGIYDYEIEDYEITFSHENGTIIATYDKNGRILNSYERFNNITLPFELRNKIYQEYPGWTIHRDAYIVTYFEDSGVTKICKLHLRKDGKKLNIKIDMDGNII
ncbi:hypothetical protein [Maribacter polysaccharolyticus]|uniref:hypothetical protein n=1 Tax=Maribacter polysaccharolyticus TaxID=3020831 RepID=UPI00237F3803|nr:hypothetical protein [Maribacter polysaccharolyticus]MDE3743402.1 hypothetical protein [Maribacter polysaccharolyticus]